MKLYIEVESYFDLEYTTKLTGVEKSFDPGRPTHYYPYLSSGKYKTLHKLENDRTEMN